MKVNNNPNTTKLNQAQTSNEKASQKAKISYRKISLNCSNKSIHVERSSKMIKPHYKIVKVSSININLKKSNFNSIINLKVNRKLNFDYTLDGSLEYNKREEFGIQKKKSILNPGESKSVCLKIKYMNNINKLKVNYLRLLNN